MKSRYTYYVWIRRRGYEVVGSDRELTMAEVRAIAQP